MPFIWAKFEKESNNIQNKMVFFMGIIFAWLVGVVNTQMGKLCVVLECVLRKNALKLTVELLSFAHRFPDCNVYTIHLKLVKFEKLG
jgi:hypothetical protein